MINLTHDVARKILTDGSVEDADTRCLSGPDAHDNADRPGATHYAAPVQPIDLIDAYDLGFYEGSIVKYVTRHRRKGGLEDLRKAAWYLARLIEREERSQ